MSVRLLTYCTVKTRCYRDCSTIVPQLNQLFEPQLHLYSNQFAYFYIRDLCGNPTKGACLAQAPGKGGWLRPPPPPPLPPWPNIWSNIYSGLSTNWEADIMWRLAYGVVKTRAYLKRWQRLKVSDRCAICNQIETFSLAFCECTLPPTVWAWVLALINQLYPQPLSFSPSLVFFKHDIPSGDQHSRSNDLTRFILYITLNELWAARNLHTFEGTPSTAVSVINKIKCRIRAVFHFSDLRDFIKVWGHKQLLCQVENKSLVACFYFKSYLVLPTYSSI